MTGRRSARFTIGSTVLVNFVNMGIGLATGVFTARGLGPTDRGVLLALVIWAGTISSFAMIGLDEAMVYESRGRPGRAADLRRRLLPSALRQAAVGFLVLLPVGLWICVRSAPEQWPAAVLVAVIVPMNTVTMMTLASMRVAEHFTMWNAVRLLPQVVYLMLLLGLFVVGWVSVWAAIVALVVGGGVTLAVALRLNNVRTLKVAPESSDVNATRAYGRRLFLAMLPAHLNLRLDQMILGVALNPAFLGIYAVAVSMSGVLQGLGYAAEQILFPRLSARTLARGSILRITMLTGLVVGVGALVLGLLARPLIVLLYGTDYADASGPLQLLAFGAVMSTMTSVLSAEAKSFGRIRWLFGAHASGMLITAVMLPLLALNYGLTGAAAASLLSYAATMVVLLLGHLHHLREPNGVGSARRSIDGRPEEADLG